MKRILLIFAAVLFTTTAFAQQWSVGGRVGSGFQALGQYKYDGKNYIEARFGASWNNPLITSWVATENTINVHQGRVMADFTLLHNWHLLDMDWTPRGGMWFVDAGAGVNVGGKAHYAYVGVAGDVAFGIRFNKPVTLSLDYRPTVYLLHNAWGSGFYGVALTCTYNF